MLTRGGRYTFIYIGAFLFTVFIAGFCATYLGLFEMPSVSINWDNKSNFNYQPNYAAPGGAELVFIYIGSSGCGYSNHKELPQRIDQLKSLVQNTASVNDREFVSIGIAKDWKTENGLEHLSKFGKFDEIITGRSWANEAIIKYVWEGSYGEPATPQIMIIDRFLAVKASKGANYEIRDEKLLVRQVGTDAIRQWLDIGAPLPGFNTTMD